MTTTTTTTSLPDGPAISGSQLFEIFTTNPFPFLRECHATFGDMFTLNLGTFNVDRHQASGAWVFLCNADQLKTLFKKDTDSMLAGAANDIQFGGLAPVGSTVVLDGREHVERRKLHSKLVQGEKKIREFTGFMCRAVEEEVSRFPTQEVFALAPCFRRISNEVMRHLTFGTAADEDSTAITARLTELGEPSLVHEDKIRLATECGGVLNKMIGEYKACPHARADGHSSVFSELMEAQNAGSALTDAQLRSEVLLMMLAGSDTAASTLSWIMAWLLLNDAVHARVRAELGQVLGDRLPQAEDIDKMDYLDAVIKEACRISPMLFNSSARLLTEPMELDGHHLPAGTILASCPHVVHTRADYYPDPLRFDPTRFLDVKPDPYRWVPFGGGIRRCLGMTFAIYEMKVVVASLLQLTRLEPVEVSTKSELQGAFYGPAGGVRVRVEG